MRWRARLLFSSLWTLQSVSTSESFSVFVTLLLPVYFCVYRSTRLPRQNQDWPVIYRLLQCLILTASSQDAEASLGITKSINYFWRSFMSGWPSQLATTLSAAAAAEAAAPCAAASVCWPISMATQAGIMLAEDLWPFHQHLLLTFNYWSIVYAWACSVAAEAEGLQRLKGTVRLFS